MAHRPKLKSKSGIYAIINFKNGKRYIGSSVNLRKRFTEHMRELDSGVHRNSKLQRAWAKYGRDSFELFVVEYVEDIETLLQREQYWIDSTNCIKGGYNINEVASSRLGMRHTDEAKQKIRDANLGKKHTEESKRKISEGNIGRVTSEESRRKMSESRRGKKLSPEHVANVAAANTGRKNSEESLQRMRDAQTARWERFRAAQQQTNEDVITN